MINEGSNKLASNRESSYQTTSDIKFVKYGVVVSVDDSNDMGRIKIRIKGTNSLGGDDDKTNDQLPYAFPLLPKHLNVTPKIGEAVFIFVFRNNLEHADRLYVGPIISQPQKLNDDRYDLTSLAGFTFGTIGPNVAPSTIPELKGVFPSKDSISIQGRFNTDITQKSNEVVLRAGKFEFSEVTEENPYNFKFNSKTQGFIQIKNDVVIQLANNNQTAKKGTVTNIVSSKINLITHENGSPRFNVTNQDNLISDDELTKILTEAHPLPFGDVLLEYLILMKEALFYHVHNGNGNQPTDLTISGNKLALASFKTKADELEKLMLSKNIRIN
jgi:hypothetical protein